MEQTGLHQGLEPRLRVLADRIGTLKEKMDRAEGLQKIENTRRRGPAGAAIQGA